MQKSGCVERRKEEAKKMIKLVQNTSNNVALTLKEQATLGTPYYVFSFVKDDSGISP